MMKARHRGENSRRPLPAMLLRGGLLLWVATVCLAPAAAVPASFRALTDPAPPRPHPQSCSEKEESCLSRGLLPFAVDSRCYEPLSRGPCAEENFWFVLESASTASRTSRTSRPSRPLLTGVCVRRPCAIGEVLYQGRCLKAAMAGRAACAGREVYLDPAGKLRCGTRPSWKNLLQLYVICKSRNSSTGTVHATSTFVASNVPCPTNDAGECMRQVVIHSPPRIIQIETED